MNNPKGVYDGITELESMLLKLQHYKNIIRLDYLEIDIQNVNQEAVQKVTDLIEQRKNRLFELLNSKFEK